MEVSYAARLHRRHERLYKRSSFLLKFLSMLSIVGAFTSILSMSPAAVVTASILFGVVAILDALWSPGDKASIFGSQANRYQRLSSDLVNLREEEIEQRLRELRIDDPAMLIDALRMPTYNEVVRSRGRGDYCEPLSRLQRFFDTLA